MDEFTVTHPFHPLKGQTFAILSCRYAWGEPRVQFLDPVTAAVRSLPIAWTSLAPIDPFVEIGAGEALLRMVDLRLLSARLRDLTSDQTASTLDNGSEFQ